MSIVCQIHRTCMHKQKQVKHSLHHHIQVRADHHEELGPFCSKDIIFLNELGRRMAIATGEIYETAHLF